MNLNIKTLAISSVLAVLAAAPISAHAQYRDRDWRNNNGSRDPYYGRGNNYGRNISDLVARAERASNDFRADYESNGRRYDYRFRGNQDDNARTRIQRMDEALEQLRRSGSDVRNSRSRSYAATAYENARALNRIFDRNDVFNRQTESRWNRIYDLVSEVARAFNVSTNGRYDDRYNNDRYDDRYNGRGNGRGRGNGGRGRG